MKIVTIMQISHKDILIPAVTSALALMVTLAAMILTNPSQIGPVGVTLWFLVLFIALSSVMITLLQLIKARMNLHDTPYRRLLFSSRQGALIGGAVTIFAALSSLRQLSGKDVILVVILFALIEFYLRSRS